MPDNFNMQPSHIQDRVRAIAFELLGKHPEGMRLSHLLRGIGLIDTSMNANTIKAAIWNLDKVSADHVYKPMRGLFRLKVFKDLVALESRVEGLRQDQALAIAAKVKALFAEWLEHEMQDVHQAMTPTNKLFEGLSGTPAVLGIAAGPSGGGETLHKGIVSAQIEVQTPGVIQAFGQACAARLFARRSYLVVPKRQRIEELMDLYALCRMFGLGLVLFDDRCIADPGFKLAVQAVDHDPDPQYEGRSIRQLQELQSV